MVRIPAQIHRPLAATIPEIAEGRSNVLLDADIKQLRSEITELRAAFQTRPMRDEEVAEAISQFARFAPPAGYLLSGLECVTSLGPSSGSPKLHQVDIATIERLLSDDRFLVGIANAERHADTSTTAE